MHKNSGSRTDYLRAGQRPSTGLPDFHPGRTGLRHTTSSQTAEIPGPVLHAFTRERGSYEESTFRNPSWTLARGAIQTSTIGDVLRSASVIGSGRLQSPASYRAFTAPAAAGLDPWSRDFYYALGIVSDNGWLTQQPSFAGYFGAMGYQPERRIAIAVASTKLEGAESDPNVSAAIYRRIAAYLAPGALNQARARSSARPRRRLIAGCL
jgi:hypothetical protein